MSIERLQEGAQSATYLIHLDSVPRGLTYHDWNELPPGKLKDVLDRAYPPGELGTNEQIARAWAAAGGSATAIAVGATIGVPLNWSFDGPTYTPVLGVPDQDLPADRTVWQEVGDAPVVVRISVSYSASE